jgi:hypothetical protein
MKKLKVGDRVEITAVDHSTDDKSWNTAEKLVEDSTPSILNILGYFIGEDKLSYQLAMGKSEEAFATKWMIPKQTILKIHKLR